jgi:hypothetical protein
MPAAEMQDFYDCGEPPAPTLIARRTPAGAADWGGAWRSVIAGAPPGYPEKKQVLKHSYLYC